MKSKFSINLEGFTACLWEVASLSAGELTEVDRQVATHSSESTSLESCQRREVYSLEGCECSAPTKLRGLKALRHLAEVAAGLDSIVLGEEQIMGQVRASFAEAKTEVLALSSHAVAAARELRRETQFSSHSGYLLDQGLSDARVHPAGALLVIGTGHMGRLVAQRGRALGFERITIGGRRPPVGSWFKDGEFDFVRLEKLSESQPVDVVVGCLGSNAAQLVTADALPPVRFLILDLGSPLNFVHEGGIPCLTISDLLGTAEVRRRREEQRAPLQVMLHESLDRRVAMAGTDRTSLVGTLRHRVERVRKGELARMKRLHPDIPEESLDAITKSLVGQIFHLPSARLKELSDDKLVQTFVELFEPEVEAKTGKAG